MVHPHFTVIKQMADIRREELLAWAEAQRMRHRAVAGRPSWLKQRLYALTCELDRLRLALAGRFEGSRWALSVLRADRERLLSRDGC